MSRSGGHPLRPRALARGDELPLPVDPRAVRGPRLDRPVPAGASRGLESAPERALRDIIDSKLLTVAWQPIVDVASGVVLGHEALCRGPRGTLFEAAEAMFASSHELELAHELDAACHEAIFGSGIQLGPGAKLFINVLPVGIVRGLLDESRLEEQVRRSGLAPSQVVLELSERTHVADLDELRARLEPFRTAGFLTAMDDIGAGYWSARLVPRVAPDFLKVDRSLVRGIESSATQQAAVAAIVELGTAHSAAVICEGIETRAELDCVRALGAGYGQGFYLAAPLNQPVGTTLPGPTAHA